MVSKTELNAMTLFKSLDPLCSKKINTKLRCSFAHHTITKFAVIGTRDGCLPALFDSCIPLWSSLSTTQIEV